MRAELGTEVLEYFWITFVKKLFCAKERLKAQEYANFLGGHESVFL